MNFFTLWSFKVKKLVRDIIIQDIDLDGSSEVIVASWDGRVYCLNGHNGSRKWIGKPPSDVAGPAERLAVAHLEPGKKAFVLVSVHKNIVAYDGVDGSVHSVFKADGWISNLMACDLDHDGFDEIIATTRRGMLYVFDDGGDVLVRATDLGVLLPGSLTLMDIDGDGIEEIFVGGKHLTMIDVTGASTTFRDSRNVYGLAKGRISPKGISGIVIAREGGIDILYLDGKLKTFDMQGLKPFAIGVSDYDGDGIDEIFVGDWNSDSLIILKHGVRKLKEVKRINVGENILSLLPADIDGDGESEVILFSEAQNQNLLIFDRGSRVLALDSYPASLGATVGDALGFGYGDIVVRTGRETISLIVSAPRISVEEPIVKGETFLLNTVSVGSSKLATSAAIDLKDKVSYMRTKVSKKEYLIFTAYSARANRVGTTEVSLKKGSKILTKRRLIIIPKHSLNLRVNGAILFEEEAIPIPPAKISLEPIAPGVKVSRDGESFLFSSRASQAFLRIIGEDNRDSAIAVWTLRPIKVEFESPRLLKNFGKLSIKVKNLTNVPLTVEITGCKEVEASAEAVKLEAYEVRTIEFSYKIRLEEAVKMLKLCFIVKYRGIYDHYYPVPFTAKVVNDERVRKLIEELKELGRSRDQIIKVLSEKLGIPDTDIPALYEL